MLAQKISLLWKKGAGQLKGMLRIENAHFQTFTSFALKGRIQTQPFVVSFKKDNIDIKTSIRFDAADITIDKDKKISGDIIANKFDARALCGDNLESHRV